MGYRRGEVCFAQRAREELWRQNPFLTTTAHICRGSRWAGEGEQRYMDNGGGLSYGEYIYSRDPKVDIHHLTIQ